MPRTHAAVSGASLPIPELDWSSHRQARAATAKGFHGCLGKASPQKPWRFRGTFPLLPRHANPGKDRESHYLSSVYTSTRTPVVALPEGEEMYAYIHTDRLPTLSSPPSALNMYTHLYQTAVASKHLQCMPCT